MVSEICTCNSGNKNILEIFLSPKYCIRWIFPAYIYLSKNQKSKRKFKAKKSKEESINYGGLAFQEKKI